MFRKKHDPVVNAILRGVYFKDEPIDLDKGKYENRLQLLKVPQLTKERILRVSPDMAFVNGEVIFTGSTDKQIIGISKPNTLFNRANITVVTTGDAVNFWIKVRYNENQESFLTLKTFSSTANDSDVLSFDLPTQTYFNLEYQLTNASTNVEIIYTFYFENPVKEAIDTVNANITNLQAIIADIANIETLNATISGNVTNLQAIIANIGTINTNINSLQAIINDIANIETLNATISGNIGTINTNITNLQAIIANIANIETLNTTISGNIGTMTTNITSLTAIIANIGTMTTNITNLQAIIADIANIETLNTTISGNITSLTAIIANIGTMNTNITNLQAIISDIANIETLNTTISGNIATVNTNINNLQAIIASIANIETLNTTISGNITSLTAIIANIGTMTTNITNLQAIIADIANIETLNTTISGNITSLTAIIANIGTMNTNINNLQAIISDIANIETQNIAMNTAIATINTNIGTINTAITSINAHEADIDINIANINSLEIDIINQENKGLNTSNVHILYGNNHTANINTEGYLYNQLTVRVRKTEGASTFHDVNVRIMTIDGGDTIYETNMIFFGEELTKTFSFNATHNIYIDIVNNGATFVYVDYTFTFAEIIYPTVIKLHSFLDNNIAKTREFRGFNTLFNTAILEFKNTGTLDLIITLSTNNMFLDSETLFTETITSGATFYKKIGFDECDNIKLVLDNNHLTLDLYFNILLFFSKKFEIEAPNLQLPTWITGTVAMTRDSAWHDVDISAIYGASKHLVFLYIYTTDTVAGQNVAFRPKGSASNYTFYTQQTANAQQKTIAVQTDSNGIFQYKALSGLSSASYGILAVLTQ